MSEQLGLLDAGRTIPTSLHSEMQRSYLEYAMSTIVGRALPDARDGLKPVHRRILFAMHELGLSPDRPFRKCARVVGDVLGKYHPHGDKAVYDALVRLVQDFASRYPLLQGHGNFGSIDNDPAAAMRYTETRLAPIAQDGMLGQIGSETVEFAPNFDNSQQEPVVLPAQLPILLLNGCSGIAVGMATNVPPHNLAELVDGLVALIDRPQLTDEELWGIIPAPDFPTGGEIVGTQGIRDAYRCGRGSIVLRGVAGLEEIPGGRGRQRRMALVITELPYQVNKAAWLEKVADLVNAGKLHGISDLRDESDREGIRVVVELKRETDPGELLQHLYKQTDLQTTFGTILLAIVEGQPRQLSLRQALQTFLDFREETLSRQYRYELGRAESRSEVLAGLLLALGQLDRVIEIIRQAPDGGAAEAQLIEQLAVNERQAREILSMPLRRLTGLERQKLQTEFDELQTRVAELNRLLGDRRELLKALKKDLRSLKKRFADDRRSRILTDTTVQALASQRPVLRAPEPAAPEEVIVEVSDRGYVRQIDRKSYERRRDSAPKASKPKALPTPSDREETIAQTLALTDDRTLVAFTRQAKAYALPVSDIPTANRKTPRGQPLITLLPESARDGIEPDRLAQEVVGAIALDPDWLPTLSEAEPEADNPPTPPRDPHFALLVTRQGRVKRLLWAEFASLTGRGLTALKLKDGDELQAVLTARLGDRLALGVSSGRVAILPVDDLTLPVQNRTQQSLVATRLAKSEAIIGCAALAPGGTLLLASAQGLGKRLPVNLLRASRPGELGAAAIALPKGDRLAVLAACPDEGEVIFATTQGRAATVAIVQIPLLGRADAGQPVLRLPAGELVSGAVLT